MARLAFAMLLAACGTEVEDRPLELPYLTQAIFAPSCGATQCHSTFKQANGVVLDTPEAARSTLVNGRLVVFVAEQYDPDEPEDAALIRWITEDDPFGAGIGRMPFDAPIPDRDVELLKEWIAAGAPGAQCNPSVGTGLACNKNDQVECNADWSFGDVVSVCPGGCVPSFSVGIAPQCAQ